MVPVRATASAPPELSSSPVGLALASRRETRDCPVQRSRAAQLAAGAATTAPAWAKARPARSAGPAVAGDAVQEPAVVFNRPAATTTALRGITPAIHKGSGAASAAAVSISPAVWIIPPTQGAATA